MALNARQRAFIAAYAGNATEAARVAGYTGSDAVLGVTGHELLKNPKIRAAIDRRQARREEKLIATREEVEQRLTKLIRSTKPELALKAMAQFAKMSGWNLTKLLVQGELSLEQLILKAEAKNRGNDGAVAQVDPPVARQAHVPGLEDSPRLPEQGDASEAEDER
jgi:phage terminase small subunit